MKKLIIGILAHVDAGKTTLTEAMLYATGQLRKQGRVDHGDAFLDTDALERSRGITIFTKQAILPLPEVELTLIDTPGHVDFGAEMERALQVLDYAILVISGSDGIQGHTRTLWQLLQQYEIPTFLFLNKLDLSSADRKQRMEELRQHLSEGCVDFQQPLAQWQEEAALCEEGLLEHFLEAGQLSQGQIVQAVTQRRLFPCFGGSALKNQGVRELLEGLERYTRQPAYPQAFGARVYKISRDAQGTRLTWLKVTGGTLRVKELIRAEGWAEKADQLRLYSGERFTQAEAVPAGGVCAVAGLSQTKAGMGLGATQAAQAPILEPVLAYRVQLPPETDVHVALRQLQQLEEEDPQLRLEWDGQNRQIRILLMGQVQLEILRQRIAQRFGLAVDFDAGRILYKETIAGPVEGVGHYEPLRHYAEVHLLLEPLPQGSGLQLGTACSEDVLDRNWQRLILTHLAEKTHVGVLAGAPITDMKLTLLTGRAHLKHTEGGDFRQATYRALRQGLMEAESILLEPWYRLRLEVPAENIGRAMTDLQQRFCQLQPPETLGEMAAITGQGPVATLLDYPMELTAYTHGRGKLHCTLDHYAPCHNTPEVLEALGYDATGDLENPADSIFCSHGAGHSVPWQQVKAHMHLEAVWQLPKPEAPPEPVAAPAPPRKALRTLTRAEEQELEAMFLRSHGPIKRPQLSSAKPARHSLDDAPVVIKPQETLDEYLLVDGYNIIFAWEELQALAAEDLENARTQLMDRLCSYQAYQKNHVILVFDAYRVRGGHRHVEPYHNITVVYTKEAETADMYIERASYDLGRKHRVRVATSDSLEQLIVMSHGCLRISARAFHQELETVEAAIAQLLAQQARKKP